MQGRSWRSLQDWPRNFYILTSFHIFGVKTGHRSARFKEEGIERPPLDRLVAQSLQKSYGMLKPSCKCNCKEDLAHNVCFAILRTGVCLCSVNSPWASDAHSRDCLSQLCKCVYRLLQTHPPAGLPVSRLANPFNPLFTLLSQWLMFWCSMDS